MSRFVEGCDRRQIALLPDCLDDYVSEDHPVQWSTPSSTSWIWRRWVLPGLFRKQLAGPRTTQRRRRARRQDTSRKRILVLHAGRSGGGS